jgi:hypothetical protein
MDGRIWAACGLLLLTTTACSGDDSEGAPGPIVVEDAGTQDTGADVHDARVPLDVNEDVPEYPGPHAAMPLADYLGGPLLIHPKLVTITYASDDPALVTRLQQFDDTITTTPWWHAVIDGYCILPAGSPCIGDGEPGGHVVLNETPETSYTDATSKKDPSTIKEFIKAHVASGDFPAPTADTLYMIYFPEGVEVKLDGFQSCSAFGAYHNAVTLTPPGGGAAIETAYAIMPRCSADWLTVPASHEILEAATDPLPLENPSYVMQDLSWTQNGGEVGDLCDYPWGFATIHEGEYEVQRGFSNKAILAGKNPCQPVPDGELYFNAAPAPGNQEIALAVGESTTLEVNAFSEAPMADWTLSAAEFTQVFGGNDSLDVSLSETTVNNRSKVLLTLTLKDTPTFGFAFYAIDSVAQEKGGGHFHWTATVRQK